MLRIGVILIVLGFGSAGMYEFTDYQFRLLMWAESMQPWLGTLVGIGGVALAAFAFVQSRKEKPAPAQNEEAAQPSE